MKPITRFTGPYAFLSNFWAVRVVLDGERYASVESAYQSAKTLDMNFRSKIRECGDDSAAVKKLGKKVGKTVALRPCWDDEFKLAMMNGLVRQKFQQPALRKLLLATGDQELEEGNWWGDRFWGVCKGEGANHLGKILMVDLVYRFRWTTSTTSK